MQDVLTVTVMLAGMFFSLCCALLLEELLFGGLFRLFFGPARASIQPQARVAVGAATGRLGPGVIGAIAVQRTKIDTAGPSSITNE